MKKLVVLLSLVAGLYANAQCFTLVDVVSNNTIKADPSPGSWWGMINVGDELPFPVNTRLFSWDLGRLVKGTFQAYGFRRYDDPNTPNVNEAGQRMEYPTENIAPCYNGTITTRFSECDIEWLSSYGNTAILREFVLQVTLYDAITGRYINTAYLRWTR